MESLKELYKIGNGPSSSHTMGSKRASQYFINKYPNASRYEVYLYGSLALTGKGHLTDYIINQVFCEKNIKVIFDYETNVTHPNTMDFIAYGEEINKIRIISVGGGSIKIEGDEDIKPDMIYPHKTFKEISQYCKENSISLSEYVYQIEGTKIKEHFKNCWEVMNNSISTGIMETGVLHGLLKVQRKANYLYNQADKADTHDKRILCSYAYAVSEQNASGGVIVTAPTCGAAGVLPAVLKYVKEKYQFNDDKIIDSMAVAGLIGNLIKHNASISGAECGCQAEIGSACAMASAASAFLLGMNVDQIEYSAEVALEHFLGLTCDPIKGYVQIPCIERNAIAAMRAIDNVSLAWFLTGSRKISFDMIVQTMKETGLDIQSIYKETSKGGMAKNYHDE